MANHYLEAAKAQNQAYERARATYSDAVARENLLAAQQSAKSAKWAAWAACAAAIGTIASAIIAAVK